MASTQIEQLEGGSGLQIIHRAANPNFLSLERVSTYTAFTAIVLVATPVIAAFVVPIVLVLG